MEFSSLPPYRGLDDRIPDRGDRVPRGGSLELGLLAIVLFVVVVAVFVAAGMLFGEQPGRRARAKPAVAPDRGGDQGG
jgi:hypothetical protein